MAVVLREAALPPLERISATAPNGAVIGVVGEDGSGKSALARLISGRQAPAAGLVDAGKPRRLIGIGDPLNLSPVATLVIEHALARHDALIRARALMGLERLRRAGATIFLVSHEQELLRAACDEIWWLDGGRLAARGDPAEILEQYNRHIAGKLRDWGATLAQTLAPALRRGDGRAEVVAIETLNEQGAPSLVWRSGERVSVRVRVRFAQDVGDPVIGIMIRTRLGLDVYGTNTEAENVRLGPCRAGDVLAVTFTFPCGLCPQEYTLTAASHDPDGVWHDWLEEALTIRVTDSRPTAGVANLRASVSVERL